VIAHAPFEMARGPPTFTRAMADVGQVAWLPRVATAMAREMPEARLPVVGIEAMVSLGDLPSSEVDLHIGVAAEGPGIHAEAIFVERTVLVSRKGHPACTRRLSRQRLGQFQHVGVEMVPGRGARDPVAAAYARARTERIVAMTVPTFATPAAVAAATDLVATLPTSLLAAPEIRQELRAVHGPVPDHAVTVSWCRHERTHADPAMAHFRALVRREPLAATEVQRP